LPIEGLIDRCQARFGDVWLSLACPLLDILHY
jgi:hypothetical protein